MDLNIFKDVGIFLAGLVIGPVVYFAKRKIERRSEHEDLEIKERLLKINKELKDQNLTPDQLRDLEVSLQRKLSSRTSPTEAQNVVATITENRSERLITQAEMNQTSYEEFEKADLELRQTYERLRSILRGAELKRLETAQYAWKEFRDKQITLAGSFYEGGSIQPLIHNVEAQALTEARTKELKALYDELQSK